MSNMKQSDIGDISKLCEIMAQLRDPATGCPWDLAQRFETVAPYTLEEAHEVVDAIERQAHDELAGELGDLLFQVVFHARMAEEAGLFDLSTVVTAICEKLVRRHPHVFDGQATPADQSADWEALKKRERAAAGHEGVLDGVPLGLSALTRAVKLGRRAAAVGFDWPDATGARAKLTEELAELDAAQASGTAEEIAAEAGDLLFAVANLCRHVGVDPEQALRGCNRRFESRFRHVEAAIEATGGQWEKQSPEQLDLLWEAAKQAERSPA